MSYPSPPPPTSRAIPKPSKKRTLNPDSTDGAEIDLIDLRTPKRSVAPPLRAGPSLQDVAQQGRPARPPRQAAAPYDVHYGPLGAPDPWDTSPETLRYQLYHMKISTSPSPRSSFPLHSASPKGGESGQAAHHLTGRSTERPKAPLAIDDSNPGPKDSSTLPARPTPVEQMGIPHTPAAQMAKKPKDRSPPSLPRMITALRISDIPSGTKQSPSLRNLTDDFISLRISPEASPDESPDLIKPQKLFVRDLQQIEEARSAMERLRIDSHSPIC